MWALQREATCAGCALVDSRAVAVPSSGASPSTRAGDSAVRPRATYVAYVSSDLLHRRR